MKTYNQKQLFQAMARIDFYPHPVTSIQEHETHISKVFLTGEYAYKVKKPVDFGFLDFTTLEKRRTYCRMEMALNRRLTENVYLDVIPITLKDNIYSLGGQGRTIEYALKMRQLPENRSMNHLLRTSEIDPNAVKELIRILSEFYSRSSQDEPINRLGSRETVSDNCEQNFSVLESFAGDLVAPHKLHFVRSATRSFLVRNKHLFQSRMDQGKVKDCHGDLRSEHIYFTEDGIQIIDCIEFNDSLRYQDIASDLAFLLMDMDYEGVPSIGQDLLDGYVEQTHDHDVLKLIDFYKSYRAMVRCKVSCLRFQEGNLSPPDRKKLREEIETYLNLSHQYARNFARPTLWIVCGLPATGKSTISNALAEQLDIRTYHSDHVRKELFALKPLDSGHASFESGIYTNNATQLTYTHLFQLAREAIECGDSVILDATFSSKYMREKALLLSKNTDANIIFVECIASDAGIKERLKKREEAPSVSDARLHHFEQMKKRFDPLEEIPTDMHIRLNTERPLKESLQQIPGHFL